MLKQEGATIPRQLFDEGVAEVNATRNNRLTTEWYAKVGDAVFSAVCAALLDHKTDTRRIHTVAAPVGGGKTSFTYAAIMAVTRNAEKDPDAPYGCVFVVDQISKADEVYRELSALLPGKVAIWTTDHDINNTKPRKIEKPAAQFERDALRRYPVIVCTHQSYLGPKGYKARSVVRNGCFGERALTFVDERPEEVSTFEVLLSEAQKVREAFQETHPDTRQPLDSLLQFMERYSYLPANRLYTKEDVSGLAWFNTGDAERLGASAAPKIPALDRLFAFAKAMVLGCGFVVSSNKLVRFIGYSSRLTVNLSAGTVLLDATADIDGVSRVVPWRVDVKVPPARYDNLTITHVSPHTNRRLKEFFKRVDNQRSYVKWMLQTIEEHVKPGERALVVCKKQLFDNERVPAWPEEDPRFKDPDSYTKRYEWDIGGRKLCTVHWGTGVGSNTWKDADVVFLFDEFHAPRRVHVANVQGLREQRGS